MFNDPHKALIGLYGLFLQFSCKLVTLKEAVSILWMVCPSVMLVLKTRIYDSAVVNLGLCVGVEVGVWLGLCLINK